LSRSLFYWMFGGYQMCSSTVNPTLRCLDPCFTGCLVGTESRGLGGKSWNYVSILVLLDVWWVQTPLCGGSVAEQECLDPCFTGCLVGTSKYRLYSAYNNNVSILVLLDVWWVRGQRGRKGAAPPRCLDPCFTGCLVGTVPR